MATRAISRLDCCVEADFYFTQGDEVVLTLIDIITYPIKLEATDCIVIFNDQCYDFRDFG